MTSSIYVVVPAVLLALTTLLWLVSLALRDASIVDIFWGFGFVVVAWIGFWTAGEPDQTSILLLVMTTIWGLRLTGYLAWRNHGKGEDYRYQHMRKGIGERFWLVSLVVVFWLQGGLISVVSLPIQAAQVHPGPAEIAPLQVVGAAMWLVGMFFEAAGDWQLARFKADPANAGRVMDRGLWRYTRHPNYFGDFMVWWGLYLVSVADLDRLAAVGWTAVGPVVMSILLLRVSGVALLEKSISERRPAYRDYIRRTSAFFPWPPSDP